MNNAWMKSWILKFHPSHKVILRSVFIKTVLTTCSKLKLLYHTSNFSTFVREKNIFFHTHHLWIKYESGHHHTSQAMLWGSCYNILPVASEAKNSEVLISNGGFNLEWQLSVSAIMWKLLQWTPLINLGLWRGSCGSSKYISFNTDTESICGLFHYCPQLFSPFRAQRVLAMM